MENDDTLKLRGALAAKLSRAYNAVESVLRDQRNKQQHYDYASAETVYQTVRHGLSEVGLAIIPSMGEYTETPIAGEGKERRGSYVVMHFTYKLVDTDTGYAETIPWVGEVMEYGDKAFNKVATNATKYMLRTLLLLPTNRDEDGDSTSPDGRPQAPHAKPNHPDPTPRTVPTQGKELKAFIQKIGMSKDRYESLKAMTKDPISLLLECRDAGCQTVDDIDAYLRDGIVPSKDLQQNVQILGVDCGAMPPESELQEIATEKHIARVKAECDNLNVDWRLASQVVAKECGFTEFHNTGTLTLLARYLRAANEDDIVNLRAATEDFWSPENEGNQ